MKVDYEEKSGVCVADSLGRAAVTGLLGKNGLAQVKLFDLPQQGIPMNT